MMKVLNTDTNKVVNVELLNTSTGEDLTLEFMDNNEGFYMPEIEEAEKIWDATRNHAKYEAALAEGYAKLGYMRESDTKTLKALDAMKIELEGEDMVDWLISA